MLHELRAARTRPPSENVRGEARRLVSVDAGPAAVERFLEFFAAAIANGRTRAAYGRAAGQFLAWCASRGLTLRAIAPLHVAAYIRGRTRGRPRPSSSTSPPFGRSATGSSSTTCCP